MIFVFMDSFLFSSRILWVFLFKKKKETITGNITVAFFMTVLQSAFLLQLEAYKYLCAVC